MYIPGGDFGTIFPAAAFTAATAFATASGFIPGGVIGNLGGCISGAATCGASGGNACCGGAGTGVASLVLMAALWRVMLGAKLEAAG